MFALHWLKARGEIKSDLPIVGVIVDAALVHKTQFYFKRIPIYYDERLVTQWYEEVIQYVHEFDQTLENGKWSRNTDSCQGKYGCCQFVDVCRMYPAHNPLLANNQPPQGFTERAWTPYIEEVPRAD